MFELRRKYFRQLSQKDVDASAIDVDALDHFPYLQILSSHIQAGDGHGPRGNPADQPS